MSERSHITTGHNPRAGNFLADSAAAFVSSSTFATALYPFHRIKILLQTQDSNPLVINGQIRRYRVLDAAPRLIREGGLRELWRGNAAYMLRHVPSTTLSFAIKDAVLRHLPAYGDQPGRLGAAAAINLTAGFLGGAGALLVVYPLDFVTIRMASELRQHEKGHGVLHTLNSTQRLGGIAALYRGFGVSAAAIGGYKAMYFGLYDTACAAMEQRYARLDAAASSTTPSSNSSTRPTAADPGIRPATGPSPPSPAGVPSPLPETPPPPSLPPTSPSTAAAAADTDAVPPSQNSSSPAPLPSTTPAPAAPPAPAPAPPRRLGVLERWMVANAVVLTASSLTYPLDVVRKRLVADTAAGPGRGQYAGLVDCLVKIAKREGLRGFYRFYVYDMLLRLGGGVLLVAYDEIKAHGAAAAAAQHLGMAMTLLPAAPWRQQ